MEKKSRETIVEETATSNHVLLPPSVFSETASSNQSESLVEVKYNGWRNPPEEWKTWVQKLKPKFEPLWVKAGIHQAIEASTVEILKNDGLILALAQRWCPKTSTFIFPWGEATITLEDLMVGWGYSVLGDPVTSSIGTDEDKEIEEKLIDARRIFNKTKAKKVAHQPWMIHFMVMENESPVEHAAFLIYWLSRFVFPGNPRDTILKTVFSIAIHLAKGTRIALAPAVLASIYRDLSLLNCNMVHSSVITLCAPFQLVQVWALERFPALQPYTTEIDQQGITRWNKVKMTIDKNLKLILDSARDTNGFLWRPYKKLDFDIASFVQCMRVSKLVGMGCVEQYLPHRVAMQFGMDQDTPAMVQDPSEQVEREECYGPVLERKVELISPCMVDEVSNLENQILTLERKVAKLKAAKFGTQVKNIGDKAMT